jgi:hypothetical protein
MNVSLIHRVCSSICVNVLGRTATIVEDGKQIEQIHVPYPFYTVRGLPNKDRIRKYVRDTATTPITTTTKFNWL